MPSQIRKRLILNVGQRKEIIRFLNENPNISYRKMAAFFAEKWNKNVKRGLAIPKKMNKMERLPNKSRVFVER